MLNKNWLSTLKWSSVSGIESLSRQEKLKRIRHSSAHIMASAIEEVFPGTIFATGPATGNGFFYDIRTLQPLSEDDLTTIEAQIKKISAEKTPFEKTEVSKKQALEYFKSQGQTLKLEILEKIQSETVSLYRHKNFVDLCAGPHVPHTGLCHSIKVLSLAAVHWKKEEKTPSLTRVYGTAWENPGELKEYLTLMKEMKIRDHRILGPKLDLFSFHDWAASALWHPHGLCLRQELMVLWRKTISEKSYTEIQNPLLYRKELFETSGHWDFYQENMFIFRTPEGDPQFALKPMNCPDTMLYYKTRIRSYRELPLRIAEGQILHRNETSGALHGLIRTRNFIQDDAHIFLAAEHIEDEIKDLLKMVGELYTLFDLPYSLRLSTRPKEFLGSQEVWEHAETALKNALTAANQSFSIGEGEGAFYGPKIDIMLRDSLGRQWQTATIQLDFQLPERFDLTYTAQGGSLKRPIVVHRAIFGSFERFIGILIEHFGGAFPTWLAPVQVSILPISEKHLSYSKKILDQFLSAGIRAQMHSEGSLSYRIRHCETQKIPYMVLIGDQEETAETLTIRRYSTKKQEISTPQALLEELQQKIKERVLDIQLKKFNQLFAETQSTESEAY